MQAGIVWAAFQLGLTRFNADLTLGRFLAHLSIGQLAGYLFLSWHNGLPEVSGIGTGLVYALGFIPSPLRIGLNSTLFTLTAFLAYGLIVGAAAVAISRERLERHE